jgi:hypothetical protein
VPLPAFASGQVYVALSRCRSIEGIRLARPIRTTDVKCDPVIKRFYLAFAEMKGNAGGEQPAAADPARRSAAEPERWASKA